MKAPNGLSIELKETIDYIMDIFAGADGGIGFVNLLALLREVEQQLEEGEQEAAEILQVIYRFKRLLEIANGDL
jgi:hypothetical protein